MGDYLEKISKLRKSDMSSAFTEAYINVFRNVCLSLEKPTWFFTDDERQEFFDRYFSNGYLLLMVASGAGAISETSLVKLIKLVKLQHMAASRTDAELGEDRAALELMYDLIGREDGLPAYGTQEFRVAMAHALAMLAIEALKPAEAKALNNELIEMFEKFDSAVKQKPQ